MRTPVCKHYSYGICLAHSGTHGSCHLLMGCDYVNRLEYPKPRKQKRCCEDYEPKEPICGNESECVTL